MLAKESQRQVLRFLEAKPILAAQSLEISKNGAESRCGKAADIPAIHDQFILSFLPSPTPCLMSPAARLSILHVRRGLFPTQVITRTLPLLLSGGLFSYSFICCHPVIRSASMQVLVEVGDEVKELSPLYRLKPK